MLVENRPVDERAESLAEDELAVVDPDVSAGNDVVWPMLRHDD